MERDDDQALARALALASIASGIDFGEYKDGTLRRRLRHRASAAGYDDLDAYVARCAADPAEATLLVEALLIKTTAMFREPATFALLRRVALPELFAARAAAGATQVRAWVPACASGEEAFSIAMCLLEASETTGLACEVVASDVDPSALERTARATIGADDARDVPPELARFLVREGTRVSLAAQVRAIVRSARHDVVGSGYAAPPTAVIASFDLVSCRNLLIYLKREAQRRVVARLIKSCADGGLVVLGEAEAPAAPGDLLAPIRAGVPVFRVR